jgi:SAM-dependent methyltransferase
MATDPVFEFDHVFDQDYLYFYKDILTPDRNASDAETIWKLLSLQTGQAVLELGCGHGRIANALAKRGATMTGVDRGSAFLDNAREDAATLGVDVRYVLADMREISWDQAFDAVFLWFTTFGYFSDGDNELVLARAVRALKPGGRLLIEQVNRNALFRDRFPLRFVVRRGNDLMVDIVDYDGLADRSATERIVVRNGEVRSARFSVRLYSFTELSRCLRALGMQSVEAFGPGGTSYTLYGNRLITVGVR